jgi:DNA-binding MarR family transcriptional regulator
MSSRPELPRRPNPFFRTFVLGQLMRTVLERELGDVPNRFGIYSAIGSMGRVTPSDLAQVVGMPPTTLSGHIERLRRQGIVRRVDNPDDRRSYLLELTDEGQAAWAQGSEGLRRALQALDRHLDRPVDEVLTALEALDAAMRAALADSTDS